MAGDPATLNDAIALQPSWLQLWVTVLVMVNLAAAFFVVKRQEGKWGIRPEPIAILVGFFAAAVIMTGLYEEYGYVRLLGLAHLIGWTPAYVWVWTRRKDHAPVSTLFGKYVLVYLVINGISLVIDAIDVLRYFTGTA